MKISTKTITFYWIFILFSLFLNPIFAQKKDILNQKISITLKNVSPEIALEKLSRVGGFDFAYASGIIPDDYKITYKADNELINSVLKQIIKDESIEYKALGSQVIFFRTNRPETKKPKLVLRGYVRDVLTGKPIQNAQMYDAYLPISAVSNANGRYELTIPNPDYSLRLTVQAEDYLSKNLRVRMTADRTLNLSMRQKPLDLEELALLEPKVPVRPSVDNLELMKPVENVKITQVFLSEKPEKDSVSMLEKTTKKIQTLLKNNSINLGLVPRISTNGKNEGQKINFLSLNGLVGYSAGSRGLEFSGLMNINRFNIKGLQFAGVKNLVGGRLAGLQFSGVSNVVRLQTSGFQFAGVSNFSGLSMQGLQFAGISNIVRGKIYGMQISCINNLVTDGGSGVQISGINNVMRGKISGIQIAGISNTSVGKVSGFQFAGVYNSGFKKFDGFQFAGAFNLVFGQARGWQTSGAFNFVSRSVKGAQIAGVSNITFGKLSGVQIAPINVADTVSGFQIGVINIARKYKKGIPIGLLNFAGYYGLEMGMEETGMFILKAKTGTKWFYNILSGGVEPLETKFWKAGYGFGSEFISRKQFQTSLDYTFSYAQESHAEPDFNFISRLDLNFYYKPVKMIGVFASISLNRYTYNLQNLSGEILESQFVPQDLVLQETTLSNQKMQQNWLGFQMGIRLF